jgi:hypothetical protein
MKNVTERAKEHKAKHNCPLSIEYIIAKKLQDTNIDKDICLDCRAIKVDNNIDCTGRKN